MKNDDPKMKPVIDLMWTVEDEPIEAPQGPKGEVSGGCGGGCDGGCGIACCCSIPNFFTKFLCN